MKIELDSKNAKKQFDIHICRAGENLEEAKILLEERGSGLSIFKRIFQRRNRNNY